MIGGLMENFDTSDKIMQFFTRKYYEKTIHKPKENENIEFPCAIFGDIHGQYEDLLKHMENIKKLPTMPNIVFLGDLVDRGPNSVKTVLYILLLEENYPGKVHIIKGNHENKIINSMYGFRTECTLYYNTDIFDMINNIFELLPHACLIGNKIFCVHGGVSKDMTLKETYSDFEQSVLLWSDPELLESGSSCEIQNSRGAGVVYTKNSVITFLNNNKLEKIFRGHQLILTGYQKLYNDKLYTIWSAPNYMGSGSMGCFLYMENIKHEQFIFIESDSVSDEVPAPTISNNSYFSDFTVKLDNNNLVDLNTCNNIMDKINDDDDDADLLNHQTSIGNNDNIFNSSKYNQYKIDTRDTIDIYELYDKPKKSIKDSYDKHKKSTKESFDKHKKSIEIFKRNINNNFLYSVDNNLMIEDVELNNSMNDIRHCECKPEHEHEYKCIKSNSVIPYYEEDENDNSFNILKFIHDIKSNNN